MLENVYEGLNAQKCTLMLKCSKINVIVELLENVYVELQDQWNGPYFFS